MVIVAIKEHSKVNRMFLHLTLSLSNLYINILQTTFSHGQRVKRARNLQNNIFVIDSEQQYQKPNSYCKGSLFQYVSNYNT